MAHRVTDTAPVTRVPDREHLSLLLDEAEKWLGADRPRVAFTAVCQAVLVAATKDTELSEFEVTRRVKRLIEAGGSIA